MDDTDATSLDQIREFLAGSADVRFSGQRRAEVYVWVERRLVRQCVGRMTVLSRAQLTRLRRVSPDRAFEIGGVSTHEVRHALHGWRHNAAGLRGQSAW